MAGRNRKTRRNEMTNKSESIKELATALAKAQSELPAAQFDATNPFFKSQYASLGSVISASRPTLAKYGLAVSQLAVSDGDLVGVTTILMHDSGEWLEGTFTMATGEERGKSSAQVAGSVITYLRRYGLASILGMYTDEDGDGNHAPQQAKAAPKPAATPESTPTPNGHDDTGMDTAESWRGCPKRRGHSKIYESHQKRNIGHSVFSGITGFEFFMLHWRHSGYFRSAEVALFYAIAIAEFQQFGNFIWLYCGNGRMERCRIYH